jgi:very-short-patch-repair endonuclease
MRRNQAMLERAQQLRMTTNAAEQRMWSIVRAERFAGLKFRRQHVIGNYIADFVCLPARLVVEVDGDTHGSDEAELKDARRTEEIERAGYRVIRFWNDYVLNDSDGGVVDAILEALMTSALSETKKARLTTYFHAPLPDPLP